MQYQIGAGPAWNNWVNDKSYTDKVFTGTQGITYTFRARVRDAALNQSSWAQIGPVGGNRVTKYYSLGAQRVVMRKGNVVYFLHGDHLGSTSLTTDASGVKFSEARYLPYGETRWGGTGPTDFGFTSQRQEAGFGLYDYNARFYSPVLGRFISADTVVPDPTDSQAFNRYAYTHNNPIMHTDPTGHCIDGVSTAVCVVAGVVLALDLVDVGSSLYIKANPSQFSAEDIDYADTSLALWQAGMMSDGPMVAGDAIAAVNGAWRGGKSLWRWGTRAFVGEANLAFRKVYKTLPDLVEIGGEQVARTDYYKRFNKWAKSVGVEIFTGAKRHHGLPQKFENFFAPRGIDIHDPNNIYLLPDELHGKLPDGIHTTSGNNSVDWVDAWADWIDLNPNATADQIYDQLEKFVKDYGITEYRAGGHYNN